MAGMLLTHYAYLKLLVPSDSIAIAVALVFLPSKVLDSLVV